jgi:hypothetical protein
MKNKLFTTLVIFGLSFIAWNCSGDPASPIPNPNPAYNPTDLSSSAIVPVALSSSSIATTPMSSVTAPVTVSSSSVTSPVIASSSSVVAPASSAQKTQSSSSVANKQSSSSQQQAKSSSAKSTKQCNGQCYDSASDKCVGYHDQQTGPKGEKYAYNESCKINCYYDPNNKNCESMAASKPASSQSQQPKSSSSKTVASSTSNFETSVELKYISGGRSGKGFASRYWDCCKPHCSWPEHAHGNYSKQCTNKGTKESSDWGGGSICSGGGLMTCTSQIPIIVNDSLAYAFAAVPAADGGSCGKCYALKFDGKGKYETRKNHQALKNKILVVMATNIGGDVQQGQFDVMIPGGGVGLFNGCSSMGWGEMGETYGGLLSKCEGNDKGYTARKDCLAEKCSKSFANDAKAKEGCMFLATWMEAAGNPTHEYKEVECPAGLKAQY